jgi:hypothetical protein
MINAWGDSHQEEGRYFSANEFYNHARKSQINNGFIPVEDESDDTTILAFFKGTAGPFSTGKEETSKGVSGEKVILKDGKAYDGSSINTAMLQKMGYSLAEAGILIKKYKC